MVTRSTMVSFSLERQILPLKLTPPPLRSDTLLRSDLHAMLAEVRLHAATLIVAPAGYGKTTLLAQWAHSLARTGAATCWLSLDAGDRDPGMFLAYLIRAIQRIFPTVGTEAWRILNSAANLQHDWPLVAGALCGDLQRQVTQTTFLFLDDLHVISDSAVIAQILSYVLRAVPSNVHLIIASRRAPIFPPLGRLRTEGLLLDIGPRELQLRTHEIATVLEAQGVRLNPADLDSLQQQSEGWPLSLQLAARALAAQAPEQRSAFVANMRQQPELIDYLAVEVMGDLPSDLVAFLQQAALPSYFDAHLLDQVLLEDAAAYQIQRAQRLGLPITAADDQGLRLRFHPIWRELLLRSLETQMSPAAIIALHRRFGHSFEQRGDLRAALDHYANAAADDELIRALQEHAWPLLESPQRDMVRRWLALLPEQQRNTNPELLYMWGYSQAIANPDHAFPIIRRAADLFRTAGLYQRELRALSDLATMLLLEQRQDMFAEVAMSAVRAANRVRDPWSRGAALTCVVVLLANQGRELAALRVAFHANTYPLNPAWHWLLAMTAAMIELRLGRPADALTRIDAALKVSKIDEDDRLRSNLMRLRALARFDLGFYAEATTAALDAHKHLVHYYRSGAIAQSAQQLALMLLLQGRTEEASTYIAQARAAFHERGELEALAALQAIDLYGALVRGQAARAVGAVGSALRRLGDSNTNAPDLRFRLLLAIVLGESGELEAAQILARQVANNMLERGYRLFLASAELYLAALAQRADDSAVALTHLQAGWDLVEADQFRHLPLLPAAVVCSVIEGGLRLPRLIRQIGQVLRQHMSEQGADLLLRLINDGDHQVRIRAITLIGELGIVSAYATLRNLTKERHLEVRQAAETALERLVYHPTHQLQVRTLGGFSLMRGEYEVRDRDWRSSKARQLFQLLLTERGRAVNREQIQEILWPEMDAEAASNNLRVTVNRLNKALEPDRPEGAPSTYLIQQADTFSLNLRMMVVDAIQFTEAAEEAHQALSRSQRSIAIAAFQRAVGWYRGSYLPDCTYDDWSGVERERLASLFSDIALTLGKLLLEDQLPHEAVGLAWRVLEQDRVSEEAYQLLIQAHLLLGERSTALRLYERCRAMLHQEFGIDPLPETIALAERARLIPTEIVPASPPA
ncbi:MAG: BTAD domain-containing putative transcriptional regulator [Roseiflexaceae bacterium]